jgi:transposase
VKALRPRSDPKSLKRFGFRNFRNYRIRALLYAGKPNWRVLGSIVVR